MRSLWLLVVFFVATGAALADTEIAVQEKEIPPATILTLEVADGSVAGTIEDLARRMGFEGIVLSDESIRDLKGSFEFSERPAWECMVAIFEAHGLTFGPGKIGQDRVLTIHRAPAGTYFYRVAGGLVVRFGQAAPGSALGDPHRPPVDLWVRPEMGVRWRCDQAEIRNQKDAGGEPAELVSAQLLAGHLQFAPAGNLGPKWPGLSAFELAIESTFTTSSVEASLRNLAVGAEARTVEHDGAELLRLEEVRSSGHLVDVVVSFPSRCTDSWVIQGGWGEPPERALVASTGWNLNVEGPEAPISPTVLIGEGSGERFKVEIRLSENHVSTAGGLDKLTVRLSKPAGEKKETAEIAFEGIIPK